MTVRPFPLTGRPCALLAIRARGLGGGRFILCPLRLSNHGNPSPTARHARVLSEFLRPANLANLSSLLRGVDRRFWSPATRDRVSAGRAPAVSTRASVVLVVHLESTNRRYRRNAQRARRVSKSFLVASDRKSSSTSRGRLSFSSAQRENASASLVRRSYSLSPARVARLIGAAAGLDVWQLTAGTPFHVDALAVGAWLAWRARTPAGMASIAPLGRRVAIALLLLLIAAYDRFSRRTAGASGGTVFHPVAPRGLFRCNSYRPRREARSRARSPNLEANAPAIRRVTLQLAGCTVFASMLQPYLERVFCDENHCRARALLCARRNPAFGSAGGLLLGGCDDQLPCVRNAFSGTQEVL